MTIGMVLFAVGMLLAAAVAIALPSVANRIRRRP
jgi:hypothetical protein